MRRQKVPNTDVLVDGGLSQLSRSSRIALEYAADTIARDHKTINGKTCLFWFLVGEVSKQIDRSGQ
jgi:hypothetical protein